VTGVQTCALPISKEFYDEDHLDNFFGSISGNAYISHLRRLRYASPPAGTVLSLLCAYVYVLCARKPYCTAFMNCVRIRMIMLIVSRD
jgi:hypothetical protein